MPRERAWLARLARRPIAAGFACFALFSAISVAFGPHMLASFSEDARAGTTPWRPEVMRWFVIHQFGLIGFAVAGLGFGIRSIQVGHAALAALLGDSQNHAAARERRWIDRALKPVYGIFPAALVFALAFSALPEVWVAQAVPPLFDPERLWLIFRMGLAVGVPFSWAWIQTALSVSLAREAAARLEIDVFDPSALAPLARTALQQLLFWTTYTCALSLILLFPTPVGMSLGFLALSAAMVAAILILPLWPLHRRLSRERDLKLADVRQALAHATRPTGESLPPGRLADLIALEGRLASARTTPFDAGASARITLYLAVGLGSWLGGALVERVVDLVLR